MVIYSIHVKIDEFHYTFLFIYVIFNCLNQSINQSINLFIYLFIYLFFIVKHTIDDQLLSLDSFLKWEVTFFYFFRNLFNLIENYYKYYVLFLKGNPRYNCWWISNRVRNHRNMGNICKHTSQTVWFSNVSQYKWCNRWSSVTKINTREDQKENI